MSNIIILSYPRSGSNFFVNNIFKHFSDKKLNIDNDICYGYYACETFPCNCNPPKKISKNHDFDAKIVYNLNYKYIFIIRKDIVLNIIAYLRAYINTEKYEDPDFKNDDFSIDDIDNNLLNEMIDTYIKITEKWCNKDNVLYIYSEDFIDAPYKSIKDLYDYFDIPIDEDITYYINIIKENCKFTDVDKTSDRYLFIKEIAEKKILNVTNNL